MLAVPLARGRCPVVLLRTLYQSLERRVSPQPSGPCAAVAAVLHVDTTAWRLLLIRRALRAGDPWSGHMALPGGHREPQDAELLDTARRETWEEVGLDLRQRARFLGPLPALTAHGAGRNPLSLVPMVFEVRQPIRLVPNPSEVQECLWANLLALNTGSHDSQYHLERDNRVYHFPAYDIEGHCVWGLTYRVIASLLEHATCA